MQGGFEMPVSSFPSERLICSNASTLSICSIPLPNRLGKYPGKQLTAHPSEYSARLLSQRK